MRACMLVIGLDWRNLFFVLRYQNSNRRVDGWVGEGGLT